MKVAIVVEIVVDLVLALAHVVRHLMPARPAGQTERAAIAACVYSNLDGLASAMMAGKNLSRADFTRAAVGVGRCGQ